MAISNKNGPTRALIMRVVRHRSLSVLQRRTDQLYAHTGSVDVQRAPEGETADFMDTLPSLSPSSPVQTALQTAVQPIPASQPAVHRAPAFQPPHIAQQPYQPQASPAPATPAHQQPIQRAVQPHPIGAQPQNQVNFTQATPPSAPVTQRAQPLQQAPLAAAAPSISQPHTQFVQQPAATLLNSPIQRAPQPLNSPIQRAPQPATFSPTTSAASALPTLSPASAAQTTLHRAAQPHAAPQRPFVQPSQPQAQTPVQLATPTSLHRQASQQSQPIAPFQPQQPNVQRSSYPQSAAQPAALIPPAPTYFPQSAQRQPAAASRPQTAVSPTPNPISQPPLAPAAKHRPIQRTAYSSPVQAATAQPASTATVQPTSSPLQREPMGQPASPFMPVQRQAAIPASLSPPTAQPIGQPLPVVGLQRAPGQIPSQPISAQPPAAAPSIVQPVSSPLSAVQPVQRSESTPGSPVQPARQTAVSPAGQSPVSPAAHRAPQAASPTPLATPIQRAPQQANQPASAPANQLISQTHHSPQERMLRAISNLHRKKGTHSESEELSWKEVSDRSNSANVAKKASGKNEINRSNIPGIMRQGDKPLRRRKAKVEYVNGPNTAGPVRLPVQRQAAAPSAETAVSPSTTPSPAQQQVARTQAKPSAVTGDSSAPDLVHRAPDTSASEPLQPPLESAWSVESVQQPSATPKTAVPTAAQRAEAADNHTTVSNILHRVASEQPSDSHIELVTPRRPRPTVARKTSRPATQSTPNPTAQNNPATTQSPSTPQSSNPPLTQSPTSPIQRSESSGGGKGGEMVQTGIGPLPSDLWSLVGDTPPTAQRSADEGRGETAVSPTNTPQSSPIARQSLPNTPSPSTTPPPAQGIVPTDASNVQRLPTDQPSLPTAAPITTPPSMPPASIARQLLPSANSPVSPPSNGDGQSQPVGIQRHPNQQPTPPPPNQTTTLARQPLPTPAAPAAMPVSPPSVSQSGFSDVQRQSSEQPSLPTAAPPTTTPTVPPASIARQPSPNAPASPTNLGSQSSTQSVQRQPEPQPTGSQPFQPTHLTPAQPEQIARQSLASPPASAEPTAQAVDTNSPPPVQRQPTHQPVNPTFTHQPTPIARQPLPNAPQPTPPAAKTVEQSYASSVQRQSSIQPATPSPHQPINPPTNQPVNHSAHQPTNPPPQAALHRAPDPLYSDGILSDDDVPTNPAELSSFGSSQPAGDSGTAAIESDGFSPMSGSFGEQDVDGESGQAQMPSVTLFADEMQPASAASELTQVQIQPHGMLDEMTGYADVLQLENFASVAEEPDAESMISAYLSEDEADNNVENVRPMTVRLEDEEETAVVYADGDKIGNALINAEIKENDGMLTMYANENDAQSEEGSTVTLLVQLEGQDQPFVIYASAGRIDEFLAQAEEQDINSQLTVYAEEGEAAQNSEDPIALTMQKSGEREKFIVHASNEAVDQLLLVAETIDTSGSFVAYAVEDVAEENSDAPVQLIVRRVGEREIKVAYADEGELEEFTKTAENFRSELLLDQLAQQIYSGVKQRIAIDRERSHAR